MKKSKKIKTAVIVAAAVTGVAGGTVAGVNYIRKNNSKTVEVLPVSALNAGDMSMSPDDATSGTVVSNVSQSVRIPDGKVIDQVYVKEGDKVKIGDKLLSYDTTLLELDQELQEITVMELGLEIKSAEADLAKLQNAKPGDPILDDQGSGGSSLLDSMDDGSADDNSDSGDEEARLVSNSREMLASQEDGTDAATESVPETEPLAQKENTESAVTEGAAESIAETEQPTETESTPETQVVPETESPAETESPVETESPTETEKPTESETVPDTNAESPEPQPANEVVVDESESNSGEVLTPDQLEQLEKNTETESETEKEKSKKNQSLEKFFTNVRMKAVTDAGEELIFDIKQKEAATAQINTPVKVVPHFKETSEVHFKSSDTYTMLIRGVTLKQQIKGKVYGTAQINEEDYPEIGGFILEQKSGSTDTVQLTIDFRDGLDQQHEIRPELEDMYLELTLQPEEVTGNELIFRTGDESKDAVVTVVKQ